ncbi:ZIP family metal transporter [Aquabacterium sp.]|uniref:ZIP family metal transporter n=1 Tax=Aquabacterium sp. TaxID=1872578 RepID=UPI003782F800
MTPLSHALLIMAIPAGVAVSGGALAALWQPSHAVRSLIQHFAAGVILAALAVELLPDIGKEHATKSVVLGAFAAGSVFMYLLKLGTERLEAHGGAAAQGAALGLLLATFVDVATDGFIIGAGFAAGGETGTVLALGLSVELLFLGLAVASERIAGWRIVGVTAALGLTVLGTAVLGSVLLAGASPAVLAGSLSFSAAALLYLVTEELLMEAHEVEEKPISTLVLFGGFLTFWGIQLMGR